MLPRPAQRRRSLLALTALLALALGTPPALAMMPEGYVGAAVQVSIPAAPATTPALTPAAIPYTPPPLSWSGCDSSLPRTARCGTLEVPRDWGSAKVKGTYSIAVAKGSAHADTAQAFVDFVASAAGQAILAKYGFLAP